MPSPRSMDGHDAVVHFAAETHVDRSIADGSTFVRTNCVGTNVLCDVANQVGVGRFLHISTDEVYGSVEEGSSLETDPLAPRSPYSAAKAGSDLIALSVPRHVRPAGRGHPLLEQLRARTSSPRRSFRCSPPTCSTATRCRCTATGGNIRDWIHVEDHNFAAQLVLEHGLRRRDLQHRRRQRADQPRAHPSAARAVRPGRVVHPAGRRPRRPRPALQRQHRQGQRTRLEACRGRFDDSLAATVDWYRTHRDWWEPLKAAADSLMRR